MTRELAAALVLGLLALLLFLAWWGWSNRRRASLRFSPLPHLSERLGEARQRIPLLYVATTLADQPYQRVAIWPLAYRAKAVLVLFDDGVGLEIVGEGDVGLTRDRLLGCGRATWTIDRAVEPDGLVLVRFLHDGEALDCYLRPVDYPIDTIIQLVAPLCGASAPQGENP